jgi:hypothetical protein
MTNIVVQVFASIARARCSFPSLAFFLLLFFTFFSSYILVHLT